LLVSWGIGVVLVLSEGIAVTLVNVAVLLASCVLSWMYVVMGGTVKSGMGVVSGWVDGGVCGGCNCPAVSFGIWTLCMEIGVSLCLMMLS
jgi:hypothetical protein